MSIYSRSSRETDSQNKTFDLEYEKESNNEEMEDYKKDGYYPV